MKKKILTKGKKNYSGRVYQEPDGPYLSVTSIIHPDGIDFPPELLAQYASRGTIVHSLTEHYLKHYQWVDPEQVASQNDLIAVKEGSLSLSIDACNPRGFFQEFGHQFEILHIEKKVKNSTHKYAGRLDLIALHEGDLAVCDIKTASSYTGEKLTDYWMQQAAYAHCVSPRPKKMVIIPLNPKSERGYDDPIIETDVKHYFSLFLKQLERVREEYILPL